MHIAVSLNFDKPQIMTEENDVKYRQRLSTWSEYNCSRDLVAFILILGLLSQMWEGCLLDGGRPSDKFTLSGDVRHENSRALHGLSTISTAAQRRLFAVLVVRATYYTWLHETTGGMRHKEILLGNAVPDDIKRLIVVELRNRIRGLYTEWLEPLVVGASQLLADLIVCRIDWIAHWPRPGPSFANRISFVKALNLLRAELDVIENPDYAHSQWFLISKLRHASAIRLDICLTRYR